MYTITPNELWMHRRIHLKERERNIPAALFSIVVIATLATSLAQPRWFSLKGGGCTRKYIGMQEFFYMGYFETSSSYDKSPNIKKSMSLIYHGLNDEMRDCVTPTIVTLQRLIISFCFMAIISSLLQFFFDTLGVMHKWLKALRRNAVGSIITVLLCVAVIGLCYYVSTIMEQQQELTKGNSGTKVEVKFDISYFLVTGAGSVAILAAAANLLRRYPILEDHDGDSLLDDYNGTETFSIGLPHSHTWPYSRDLSQMNSAPPPYAP